MCRAIFKTVIAVLCLIQSYCTFAQSVPLPNAFAHNDYFNKHPLHDALTNGYTSIEADVFLRGKNLVVAHINPYFKSHRKLEDLYLKPLLEQVVNNNGEVYEGYNQPITLLIDIKSDANSTYNALKPLLEKYSDILTSYNNGKITFGAVTIVLSGNKPSEMIKSENDRLAFIDKDLRKPNHDLMVNNVYTMASCKYSKMLKWQGNGVIPEMERQRLVDYVSLAHMRGEKVRLWASPENRTVWDELLKCGVDLINTNKLVALKQFLISNAADYSDPLIANN